MQFQFRSWVVWKVHLIAAAVAFAVRAGLALLDPTKAAVTRSDAAHIADPHGLYATAVGGVAFGFGVALCGADPASLVVQLSTGVVVSFVTLAGAMLGSFAFAWLKHRQPAVDDFLVAKRLSEQQLTLRNLHPAVRHLPRWQLSLVLAGAAMGLFLMLSLVFGTGSDLKAAHALSDNVLKTNEKRWLLTKAYWSPWSSGAVLGLLLIPAIAILHIEVSLAKTYTALLVLLVKVFVPHDPGKIQQKVGFDSVPAFKVATSTEFEDYWPLLVGAGLALGGLVSALLSRSLFPTLGFGAPGVVGAFLGGFIMIFGARMVGSGGFYGLGVVACSSMSTRSFVAVVGTVVGGVVGASFKARPS